jgi:hypothetical protein
MVMKRDDEGDDVRNPEFAEGAAAKWAEWGGDKSVLRTPGGMETAAFRSNIPDS